MMNTVLITAAIVIVTLVVCFAAYCGIIRALERVLRFFTEDD